MYAFDFFLAQSLHLWRNCVHSFVSPWVLVVCVPSWGSVPFVTFVEVYCFDCLETSFYYQSLKNAGLARIYGKSATLEPFCILMWQRLDSFVEQDVIQTASASAMTTRIIVQRLIFHWWTPSTSCLLRQPKTCSTIDLLVTNSTRKRFLPTPGPH